MDQLTVEPPQATAPSQARPHAVVIGSGFGGLAAAVRLGSRGWRVTVLERNSTPGGRAAAFTQDGFTFDFGPTIVTAPFLFEELWTLCGRRMADDVTLVPLDPFYRIRFDDGSTFAYSGSAAAMRAEVARFSVADVAGYDRFMALSAKTCRIGFDQLGHVPFGTVGDMLRVAPDLLRLQAWRSVYAASAAHFRDEKLRTVFSFHPLLIGGNPFAASAIYALISHLEQRWGVHWARGGTGSLVRGLVGLIEGQGGAVRCDAEVARIALEGRRATGVVLAGGEAITADIVVSNADPTWTERVLLPETAPRRRPLRPARHSMGLFVWHFGTSRQWPAVGHHTILLGPRYRGLLRDIFSRRVLAKDFSLYLHRPTATEPGMAPAGCDAFYVLSPVPNLSAGIDWATAAEPYRRAIAAKLEATLLPGLGTAIVTQRVVTPQHFRDDLLSWHGAGFGLEPVLTQSAWFRPHNRSAEIEGLFLVGAGTHPGAGLPGVLSSARILDTVVPPAHAYA